MKKSNLLLLAIIFIISSCSSSLDKKYNEETFVEDVRKIKEERNLNEEETKLIIGWIMKSKLKNENISKKTYRVILNEAESFKKEKEELAIKAKKQQMKRKKE